MIDSAGFEELSVAEPEAYSGLTKASFAASSLHIFFLSATLLFRTLLAILIPLGSILLFVAEILLASVNSLLY